ncbi:MAG TPA: hypothetical protein VLV86_02275 [Vicinamibacterales bacterium]|nr:hypothetical protein [Vicinamibacterales bacterium]
MNLPIIPPPAPGVIVKDAGTPVGRATKLNITGATVTVDGPDPSQIDITVTGGGGGTVTQVDTGNGLQGGPITSTGTVDLLLNASGGLSKTLGVGSNELGIAAAGVTSAMLASGAAATNVGTLGGDLLGSTLPNPVISIFRGINILVAAPFATGTSEPASIPDASMAGLVPGGSVAGVGNAGVLAATFTSLADETGTGSGQGGLGSTPSATQPYNSTDFPGIHGFGAQLRTASGNSISLGQMLSTAPAPDNGQPVFGFLSYRSDLGANLKWRLWYYYSRTSDGYYTSFTPDTSIVNAQVFVANVFLLDAVPVGYPLGAVPTTAGVAGVQFGSNADVQPVYDGPNMGGSTGRVADAGHMHDHGSLTDPDDHALATALAHGFLSSSDFSKLAASTASVVANTLVQRDALGSTAVNALSASTVGVDGTHQNTVPVVNGDTFTLNAASQVLTNKSIDGASNTITNAISLAAVGSSPNADGASFSTSTLTLQPADGTHPGLITSGTQTIGGDKTFSGAISASNLSGTNSGDVTLTAVGSSPSANGASLSGQALTLQPADGTHPGLITSGTQTIGGAKTFSSDVTALSLRASGTAGAGFDELLTQSSNPSTPASGFRLFAGSAGQLAWIRQSDGFVRTITGATTADRAYTTPDAPGALQLTNALVTKTTTYVITLQDFYGGQVFLVDTSGGPFTMTLPNPATLSGYSIKLKGSTGSLATNNLTLARFGSEKIENVAASKVFQTNYGSWQIYCDGTNWWVL